MVSCRRRRSSALTSPSFARNLVRIVCRSTVNFPARVFTQLCVKPRKLKVSGLPAPTPVPVGEPTELDEARLVRVQLQAEPREPLAQLGQEALGLLPMLEPDDEVIS